MFCIPYHCIFFTHFFTHCPSHIYTVGRAFGCFFGNGRKLGGGFLVTSTSLILRRSPALQYGLSPRGEQRHFCLLKHRLYCTYSFLYINVKLFFVFLVRAFLSFSNFNIFYMPICCLCRTALEIFNYCTLFFLITPQRCHSIFNTRMCA